MGHVQVRKLWNYQRVVLLSLMAWDILPLRRRWAWWSLLMVAGAGWCPSKMWPVGWHDDKSQYECHPPNIKDPRNQLEWGICTLCWILGGWDSHRFSYLDSFTISSTAERRQAMMAQWVFHWKVSSRFNQNDGNHRCGLRRHARLTACAKKS